MVGAGASIIKAITVRAMSVNGKFSFPLSLSPEKAAALAAAPPPPPRPLLLLSKSFTFSLRDNDLIMVHRAINTLRDVYAALQWVMFVFSLDIQNPVQVNIQRIYKLYSRRCN